MSAMSERPVRQRLITKWAVDSFTEEEALSVEQRGLRLLEEAIELAQVCRVDKSMIHKLVDYVYGRPVGQIQQEIGGVGLTLLVLGEVAHVDVDLCEVVEIQRVLIKPKEFFAERNHQKNAAGFRALSLSEKSW